MQVTETLNSGLKREIKVTVPATDLESRLMNRLTDARGKVRINGFRPGKVPVQHLRKVYGKSFMAEVVNEILSNSTREILAGRGEKAAMQPDVTMTEDEKEADKVLSGEADFEFSIAYEVIPSIQLKDPSSIAVTRQVYDVPETEIEDQLRRVAESSRSFEVKDGPAVQGDRLTIDYVGKADGEAFSGGTDTDAKLVIGSNQFIPGFEEQLVGASAGDVRTLEVTFPSNYVATNLAGKDATFEVTVKEVASPGSLEINDETAKSLGLESLDKLREAVKGQIESQYGAMTRQKVKRELLDALDKEYQFEAPSKLVEAEFSNIWRQVTRELEQAGRGFEDEGTTEEAAREDYRKLAERRVRLGLVLSEIGTGAGVQVSDEEMQRALFEHIRRFPGQEQQIYDAYRNNPDALASLRAPLFEEKVVDHLLSQVSVTDKAVTKEELLAEESENADAPATQADAAGLAEETAKPAKKKASRKKAEAPEGEADAE